MRSYEMVFIVRPDLEGEEVDELVTEVQELVQRNDGETTEVKPWGLHKLAYPINKHQEGHYFLMTMDLGPAGVRNLERALKLKESVIRHMIIRLED